MDAGRDWVAERLADAPARLRDAALAAWDAVEARDADARGLGEAATRCARAALHLLADAERIGRERASAIELLAADALLTLACERIAEVEPARLAEFARSIGPAGAFAAG